MCDKCEETLKAAEAGYTQANKNIVAYWEALRIEHDGDLFKMAQFMDVLMLATQVRLTNGSKEDAITTYMIGLEAIE